MSPVLTPNPKALNSSSQRVAVRIRTLPAFTLLELLIVITIIGILARRFCLPPY